MLRSEVRFLETRVNILSHRVYTLEQQLLQKETIETKVDSLIKELKKYNKNKGGKA